MQKSNGTHYIFVTLAALILGTAGTAYTQAIAPTLPPLDRELGEPARMDGIGPCTE